jgi:hypothetical protein
MNAKNTMPGAKGIMRIRPGLLANFSGGAGYMPFVLFMTAPLSLVSALISHLVLYGSSKRWFKMSDSGSPVDLISMQRHIQIHMLICVVLAIIMGLVFVSIGSGMVYGDKLSYLLATIMFGAGPFAAWCITTLFLAFLLVRKGARWFCPVIALLLHVVLVGVFVGIGILLS